MLDTGSDPVQHLPERLGTRRLAAGPRAPGGPRRPPAWPSRVSPSCTASRPPQLVELAFELAHPRHHLPGPFLEVLGVRLHEGRHPRLALLERAHPGERPGAGHRLDTPHPGRDAGLGNDLEQAHVAGAHDVGSAAELERHVSDGEHPHVRVVLLAEEGDRTPRQCVIEGHGLGADLDVVEDPVVDEALDSRAGQPVRSARSARNRTAADPERRATPRCWTWLPSTSRRAA